MDLWIRSQNKKILIETEYLDIVPGSVLYYKDAWQYNKYIIINCTEQGKCVSLGFYKSEERALEVLDEIQLHLVNINDSRDSYFYVYEMPVE